MVDKEELKRRLNMYVEKYSQDFDTKRVPGEGLINYIAEPIWRLIWGYQYKDEGCFKVSVLNMEQKENQDFNISGPFTVVRLS